MYPTGVFTFNANRPKLELNRQPDCEITLPQKRVYIKIPRDIVKGNGILLEISPDFPSGAGFDRESLHRSRAGDVERYPIVSLELRGQKPYSNIGMAENQCFKDPQSVIGRIWLTR